MSATLTNSTYHVLDQAYEFFNDILWGGQLPTAAILLQRKGKAYGYFSPERISTKGDNAAYFDEIALNPDTFAERELRDVLGTLVHEMAHLWQEHYGSPSRNGYHNAEWAEEMKRVGLYPSTTGDEGGKETGQKCSHYIVNNGSFAKAFDGFSRMADTDLSWFSREAAKKEGGKKVSSKVKYTCSTCEQNAWAKPGAKLVCGNDSDLMVAENVEEGNGESNGADEDL